MNLLLGKYSVSLFSGNFLESETQKGTLSGKRHTSIHWHSSAIYFIQHLLSHLMEFHQTLQDDSWQPVGKML